MVSVVRITTTGIHTGRRACLAAGLRYDGSSTDISTAKGQYCAAYNLSNAGAKSADCSCNPNYDVSQLGVVTRWTPVKNLTFSAEVMCSTSTRTVLVLRC